jgi:Holliday junction resolvasome RuvABC endonuclease subunit
MTVIGIDPGTACGWALLAADGSRIGSGTWDLRPRRHEGGGMRYLRARRMLAELLDAAGPDVVLAYEEVRRHMGVDAAHVYGGIVAQVAALCEERGVPYRGVPVGTVKKAATGNGSASKGAMVEAAGVRWGGVEARHASVAFGEDEADALWIAEALRLEVSA